MPSTSGTVKPYTDDAGNTVWKIELNDSAPMQVPPGDVLLWVDSRVESMSQNDFDSKYAPGA